MLTAKAVLHGDRDYLLGFNPEEHPVALQLGGSEPAELAEAARIGAERGYDEINLNVGCPSDRVQSGRFGACLMAEPGLVGDCVDAMQQKVDVPVTVKCRIGIDRDDSYELFEEFVETVAAKGCTRFYVHARKAWLDGLSPRENRDIPPLRYEYVYRLKKRFPSLEVVINGGIAEWDEIEQHLQQVDGVMLGRAAYYSPAMLFEVDSRLFGVPAKNESELERFEHKCKVARDYARYMDRQRELGAPLTSMSRHLVSLIQRQPGAKQWRRLLSTHVNRAESAVQLVESALLPVIDGMSSMETVSMGETDFPAARSLPVEQQA